MTDVVIPAHDEAATVGAVVRACRDAPSVSSVIVVADNCTDGTADQAHRAGADLVVELVGPGDKGTAMAAGLAQVTTDDVVFVDADLVGLAWQHVEYLATAPPYRGQLCGLRDEPYTWGQKRLPPITGERRLPTMVARGVDLPGSGYRAETLLNAAVGAARLPHRTVVLVGVKNPTRLTRQPLSWLLMWGDLALLALVKLPALIGYVIHPDG